MSIIRHIIILLVAMVACAVGATAAVNSARAVLGKPDLEAIRAATTDEHSRYYYPTLLRAFLRNDTVMSDTEYQYFYYGTLFQEDFDPYRKQEEAPLATPSIEKTTLGDIEALAALKEKLSK